MSEIWPDAETLKSFLNPKANAEKAAANWALIQNEFAKRKITDRFNLGCAFATAIIETASTMMPIHEYGNDEYFIKHYSHILGNNGPADAVRYAGRGFIQLTGRNNYEKMGKALSLPLASQPDLMLQAEPAARAFVAFWCGDLLGKSGLMHCASDWCRQLASKERPVTDMALRLRCLKNTRIAVNGGLNGWERYHSILTKIELS